MFSKNRTYKGVFTIMEGDPRPAGNRIGNRLVGMLDRTLARSRPYSYTPRFFIAAAYRKTA